MLSPEQIAHFEAFGFLLLRRLLDPGEAATLKREAEEVFDEDRGGRPFPGETTEFVQPFFERRPFLFSLLDDDRIHGIGVDLLGPDFVLDQTEGRLRVEPTAWHAGDPFPQRPALDQDRVLPRDPDPRQRLPARRPRIAHPVQSRIRWRPCVRPAWTPDYRPFGLPQEEIPHVPLEVEPGDIVVFTESVLHGAFGGRPGRHQHAINFFSNPRTDAQVAEVREVHDRTRWSVRPTEALLKSGRPRIRRMISKLVELGFEPPGPDG